MSFYTMNYPVCKYCGDVFPLGDTNQENAKLNAVAAGWQAYPDAWIFNQVIGWTFYCPTHLRDDDGPEA